jgi:RNA polymerase sigma-70 factor (ECF subfamily)
MNKGFNNHVCDETVFTNFFKNQVKPLRNYLLYKFGDYTQAEDVAQEVFIKLWQNCLNVPLEKAKSYIYTIATNTSLNVISHKKVILEYKKNNPNQNTSNENPEFILEEQEFKNQLLKAIENLPETQKIAFLMNRIDGKKYREIAEELNISVKAVEKRIHLALLELRKINNAI